MDTITLTDPKLSRQIEALASWYDNVTPEQLLASFAQRQIDMLTDHVPDLEVMLERSSDSQ